MPCSDLMSVAARSQNTAIVVAYDESTFFLRRCRSCSATVDTEALFGVGISGSGAVAETIRWRNEPGYLTQTRGEAFQISAHDSAPEGEGTGGSFWRSFPLSFAIERKGPSETVLAPLGVK